MNKLERNKNYSNKSFEDIKHIDENGIEYWYARELQSVLDYKEWRKFEGVIQRAEKTQEEVVNMLKAFGVKNVKDVFIASIDCNGKMFVQQKKG